MQNLNMIVFESKEIEVALLGKIMVRAVLRNSEASTGGEKYQERLEINSEAEWPF